MSRRQKNSKNTQNLEPVFYQQPNDKEDADFVGTNYSSTNLIKNAGQTSSSANIDPTEAEQHKS